MENFIESYKLYKYYVRKGVKVFFCWYNMGNNKGRYVTINETTLIHNRVVMELITNN